MLESTIECKVLSLLQNLGALEREQILRFFSAEVPATRLEVILKHLDDYSMINYNKATDTYAFHSDPLELSQKQKLVISAFWIAAANGSHQTLELCRVEYPQQYLFVDTRNLAFDVTMVYDENTASLAYRLRKARLPQGVPDLVTHLGVVRNHELGAKLIVNYGFDYYVMVNPETKEITYYDYEEKSETN